MSYFIGSFNIRKLGETAVQQRTRDFPLIARIIADENIDIVALQEMFHDSPVQAIARNLGAHWQYRYENKGNEGYAFLWNSRRISLMPTLPPKASQFHEPYIDNRWGLIRPPLIGRFIPTGGMAPFVEFRIINTHIYFGGTSSGNILERHREYQKLSGKIYTKIAQQRDGNFRPAYTFIAGDYNLHKIACETSLGALKDSEFEMCCFQEHPTTLKKNDEQDVNNSDVRYTNNDYDHFTCSSRESEYLHYVCRIDAPSVYCGQDFKLYNDKVSDHVPVKLHFNLRESV